MQTKIYRNDSDSDMNVVGLGLIPAGEQISITSKYLPVVIVENYPGLTDVIEEEAAEAQAAKPDVASAEEDEASE